MPEKNRPLRARPGQDIVAAKKASQFPSVGVTLSSYKSADIRPRRPASQRSASASNKAVLPTPSVQDMANDGEMIPVAVERRVNEESERRLPSSLRSKFGSSKASGRSSSGSSSNKNVKAAAEAETPAQFALGRSRPAQSAVSQAPRGMGHSAASGKKGKNKVNMFKKIAKWFGIVLGIIVIVLVLWLGGKIVMNVHKIFGGSIFGALHATKLKGEDQGRVTILLAGNSADDPGHDGANLTDSIMLLSIDTKNNTAFMMSIPRDLWVDVPGAGYEKINAAYPDGQSDDFNESGYPSGGMGLLEQIIEENFGIDIDYYALINYDGIKDAVNAVGGITVDIKSSDPRGLYDPSIDWSTHGPLVKLSNGEHTLNGEQALDLARARGDAYGAYGFDQSDFTRTQNQRMMLLALKDKVTTAGVMTNPAKLASLTDAAGNNIKTDMNISEARRLYDLTKAMPESKIASIGLNSAGGKNLLSNYTAPTSPPQSALIPAAGIDDYSDIQDFMNRMMSDNPIVREGARVVVLNGTDTDGLANRQKTYLEGKHMDVVGTGDADVQTYATSKVVDLSGGKMPGTLAALKSAYGANVTTTDPFDGAYNADFIVIVGADKIPKTTTSTTTTTNP